MVLERLYGYNVLFKALSTLFALGFGVAGLCLFGVYKYQNKLVYPAYLNDGHGKVDTPDQYGMNSYKLARITTKDGETLYGYLVTHDPNSVSYTNKTVVVFCPNAGNIGHFLPVVQILHLTMGYNVFIYSYRGYGNSTGVPSEAGLKIDAERILEYLCENEQIAKSSLIFYGRSLGGAVAIYLASQHPDKVAALVLENTFLSIREVIPHVFPLLAPVKGLCHEVWDSESAIQKIPADIPICFFSGEDDEIVPPSHMARLCELSKSREKEMHIFPGAKHNDTIIQKDYWVYFQQFLVSRVNPRGR
ncbi:unnamed protein product [Kuraishia capsulata CBS 1993]|uniref:AB hydrolase-1 domain-containing protein n=1 Tax=Kuraishia capsulata CBS 1993 TaxID=1382522 RepID=W6MV89_9ASCO|nr:uncharacterized protein KUCA_T00002111001 [Kuraishia capsulata CBS 1993]CDK26140.1 unnamed protein product [Kuraishia capsulata CBS 1993]